MQYLFFLCFLIFFKRSYLFHKYKRSKIIAFEYPLFSRSTPCRICLMNGLSFNLRKPVSYALLLFANNFLKKLCYKFKVKVSRGTSRNRAYCRNYNFLVYILARNCVPKWEWSGQATELKWFCCYFVVLNVCFLNLLSFSYQWRFSNWLSFTLFLMASFS